MYLHFYVYAYLRKDGTPYYIGKGRGLKGKTISVEARMQTSLKLKGVPKSKSTIEKRMITLSLRTPEEKEEISKKLREAQRIRRERERLS